MSQSFCTELCVLCRSVRALRMSTGRLSAGAQWHATNQAVRATRSSNESDLAHIVAPSLEILPPRKKSNSDSIDLPRASP